jgi:hypothetical protein
MSTIVFTGIRVSDKKLLKETSYRYHPNSDMKEQILADLKKHIDGPIPENIIIDLNIDITLKEYDLNL